MGLDDLVQTLLYEGYALYPYTPDVVKNATPTPFGVVYPPIYAQENPATFDHARVQCLAAPAPGATLSATLWFLRPSGERNEAHASRLEIPPIALAERVTVPFAEGRVTLRSEVRDGGLVRVSMCVHNTLTVPEGLDRARALAVALVSTHMAIHISRGRFYSPLDSEGCASVNTWPVLASPADDTILAAAIVLPDHPQLAPESRGELFDNTEIEEALLLHVQTLSDVERERIATHDPAVREMLERALAVTPEEIFDLHGRLSEVPDE